MTIQQVKNKLIEHFIEKDYFSLNEHFLDIFPLSALPELEKSIVIAALDQLVDDKYVTRMEVPFNVSKRIINVPVWCLNKSLYTYSQSVPLNYNTVQRLAAIFDFVNVQTNACLDYDCLYITEKDIQNLIVIAENSLGISQKGA